MKKKMNIFLAAIIFLTVSCSFAVQNNHQRMTKAQKRQRIVAAYLSSLLLSGATGALTGGALRYLEKKLKIEENSIGLFLILLGWALESEFRNDVILALQKDLDLYEIEHKKGLMFKSAWIASWISYLHG